VSALCKKECGMPIGKIKKLVTDKGFGFIQPDNGPDVFIHHSTVADKQFDNLTEGQKVEFTVDQGGGREKGPRAASVQPM
jgi:CspA family cold shock protein